MRLKNDKVLTDSIDIIQSYIEDAKLVLEKNFPYGDTYSDLIFGSIEIAKLIQIEEMNKKNDIVTY